MRGVHELHSHDTGYVMASMLYIVLSLKGYHIIYIHTQHTLSGKQISQHSLVLSLHVLYTLSPSYLRNAISIVRLVVGYYTCSV